MCLKKIILYFILCFSLTSKAQNLVTNGDFEVYSQCPNGTSSQSVMQIDYATGWSQSALSPDYYNACAGIGNVVDVPYSNHGYQQDCCGGNGFAGMYMFTYNTTNDGREYIYSKLSDTLIAGHKYIVGMYVNRSNGFNYSVATVGMLFTDTIINLPWPQGYIPATPQVKNTTLLNDTANWVLVQDTITANGTEVYLTIGNFNSTATSDTVKSGGTWWYYGAAYYYIDNVSVVDVATIGVNEIKNREIEISIFPNPSTGNFTLQHHLKENAVLEITDVNGNLVDRYNIPAINNMTEIKNDKLQNGIYLYRVISNSNTHKVGKIVVMK